jgi:hypothetical protein
MDYEYIKKLQEYNTLCEKVKNMCPTQELKDRINIMAINGLFNIMAASVNINPDFKGPSLNEMLEK